ncbi:AAA family ATPase [Actinomyces oris]|jgi:probable atp/GTP-binding protein, mmyx|uniref:AAA family ATPase n=1 Tax=Actinomyces oris TaxID=544580 RepID=UPI0028D3300D|nr:AAA family ATPase [Actinomyces oris]
MRISISGTYSTGKTSTAICLSHYTGIPRTLAKAIREIMPDAVPGKRLSEVTPAEFLQLMMRRHCGRAVAEAKLGDNYLSDGSSLQEWAYGLARTKYGMNPTDPERPNEKNWPGMNFYREVVDQYEHAFKQHVKASYDVMIHLDNERPITNDGHRPMNEQFRVFCDELLWNAASELDIPLYRISGTLTNRVENIVSLLDLPTVTTLDYAIGKMEQEYAAIDKRLETERQRTSSSTSTGTNR